MGKGFTSRWFDEKDATELKLFLVEDDTSEKMIFMKWNGELYAMKREIRRVLNYDLGKTNHQRRENPNAIQLMEGMCCVKGDGIFKQYTNMLKSIGQFKTPHSNSRRGGKQKVFCVIKISSAEKYLKETRETGRSLQARQRLIKYICSARECCESMDCKPREGQQEKRNVVGIKDSLRQAVESAIADIDLKEKTMLALMTRIAVLANENESYKERINQLEKDINEIKLHLNHVRALNIDDIRKKTQMFIESITTSI